ncbi:hypothetical protein [Calycomorphotria hydatis]|nr:hypothetical protein [Calycomorphotria hydatis]
MAFLAALFHRPDALGTLSSMFLHAALLLIMAMYFFIDGPSGPVLSIDSRYSADDETSLDALLDTAISMPSGGTDVVETTVPVYEPIQIESDLSTLEAMAEFKPELTANSSGNGIGDSVGDGGGELGGGLKFALPKSGAVTKGSFTAWTIPEDPIPGQNYSIIIQIKLPENLEKKLRFFPLRDLSGMVRGTDGYMQRLPGVGFSRLPIKEGVVQYPILVPGAARLVKDKIKVRSKMLQEVQELELEF